MNKSESWSPPRRTSLKTDIACRPGESLASVSPSQDKWWIGPFDRMAESDLRHWKNRHKIASHLISAIVFDRARELSDVFKSGASIALMYSWDVAGVLSPGQLIRIPVDGKDPEQSIDEVAEKIAKAVDHAAIDIEDYTSLCVEVSAALSICRDETGAFYVEMNLRMSGVESSSGRTVTPPGIAISNIQAEYALGKRDFSKRLLRGCDLRNCNLSDSNFHSADLRFSNLRACDLSRCNLTDANLRGSDLSWANLRGANVSGINLSGCNLENADLPD